MIEQIETFYGKLTKRQQILFVVAVIMFVIALMDLFMLGPILSHIRTLDADIVTKSETVKRDMRLLSYKDVILKEYSQYMNYMDSGDKTQEQIISALLNKIEVVAESKQVAIANIQPGEVTENPVYHEYKTSLSGEGTLLNVLGFMHELEESDYLFQVTKYDFAPKSKGADIVKFNLDIWRVLVASEKFEGELGDRLKQIKEESEVAASPAEPGAEEVPSGETAPNDAAAESSPSSPPPSDASAADKPATLAPPPGGLPAAPSSEKSATPPAETPKITTRTAKDNTAPAPGSKPPVPQEVKDVVSHEQKQ